MSSESLQFTGTNLDTLGVGALPLTTYSGTLAVDYAAGTVSGSLEVAPALNIPLTNYSNFTLTANGNNGYTITGTGETLGLVNSTISIQYTGTTPTAVSTQYYLAGAELAAGTNGSVASSAVVCFATGTGIRTPRGDVPIEALAVGEIVVTASGEQRPVRWLGHRTIDCSRHPRPVEVMPVRIGAHAFGENRPAHDLVVSPGHAICVDVGGEVLIPAIALVNGSTITQLEAEKVTYWHVELDSHDVILAESLPAESYLEMGNRSFFAEAATINLHARPDAPVATHADFCRPFIDRGPLLDVVKARLAKRAGRLGDERHHASAAA